MAMNSIEGPNTLLWGSIPCTGGCPWQRINKNRPGGEAKLRMHISAFKKIWKSFVQIARAVLESGGSSQLSDLGVALIGGGQESRR